MPIYPLPSLPGLYLKVIPKGQYHQVFHYSELSSKYFILCPFQAHFRPNSTAMSTPGKMELSEILPKVNKVLYKKAWENLPECYGWLTQSRNGKNAVCKPCRVTMDPNLTEIKKHARARKHVDVIAKIAEYVVKQ